MKIPHLKGVESFLIYSYIFGLIEKSVRRDSNKLRVLEAL